MMHTIVLGKLQLRAWKIEVGKECVAICQVSSILLRKNSFSDFFDILVRIKVCLLF